MRRAEGADLPARRAGPPRTATSSPPWAATARSTPSPAALAGTPTPLLVLPAGTLNHFAKDLGVPLDPAEAALLVRDGVRRSVDVAEVNGRVFVNNSVDRRLSARRRAARAAAGRGRRRQVDGHDARGAAHVPALSRRVHVRIASDDGEIALETPFVFVGNNVYGGEGVEPGERERLDAGLLGVLTTEATTRREALRAWRCWRRSAASTRPAACGSGETAELTVETAAALAARLPRRRGRAAGDAARLPLAPGRAGRARTG